MKSSLPAFWCEHSDYLERAQDGLGIMRCRVCRMARIVTLDEYRAEKALHFKEMRDRSKAKRELEDLFNQVFEERYEN